MLPRQIELNGASETKVHVGTYINYDNLHFKGFTFTCTFYLSVKLCEYTNK